MKMLSLLYLILSVCFLSVARADDQSSGCGLGWMVTKRKSLVSSLVRAWTNATFSSTLGMTTGTSGCGEHSIVKNDKKGLYFTESNYNELMVEMAAGKGEFLQNYAQVLGCSSENYPNFARKMQQHYDQIFTTDQVSPREVLNNVIHQLRHDQALGKDCASVVI